MSERKKSGLNFGDVELPKIKKSKPTNDVIKEVSSKVAVSEGFSNRTVVKPIDGRTLRKTTKKTQFNIAVDAEVKNKFWELAQLHNMTSGGDFLKYLLEETEKKC